MELRPARGAGGAIGCRRLYPRLSMPRAVILLALLGLAPLAHGGPEDGPTKNPKSADVYKAFNELYPIQFRVKVNPRARPSIGACIGSSMPNAATGAGASSPTTATTRWDPRPWPC